MKTILTVALVATAMFSCKKKDDVTKAGTFTGSEVEVQHGKGWSWVKLNADGNPEQLGLSINDAAINSMPVGTGGGGTHTHDNSVVFPLHAAAKANTPFDHLGVDWNPNGHEPAGIYDKPHFDFHFYMITEGQQAAATDMTKLETDPAADYLPANFIGGAPVPQMGKHWIDVTSPELTGQVPFTQTFIYGSYDGKVTFLEPMITLDFLKATTTFVRPIPQPAKYKKEGYYPTRMRISKHDGVTDVVLEGFVKRQAS
jgi:hypothetical protein